MHNARQQDPSPNKKKNTDTRWTKFFESSLLESFLHALFWSPLICFYLYQRQMVITNYPTLYHLIFAVVLTIGIGLLANFFVQKYLLRFTVVAQVFFFISSILLLYWGLAFWCFPRDTMSITRGSWVNSFPMQLALSVVYFALFFPLYRMWLLQVLSRPKFFKHHNSMVVDILTYCIIGFLLMILGGISMITPEIVILGAFFLHFLFCLLILGFSMYRLVKNSDSVSSQQIQDTPSQENYPLPKFQLDIFLMDVGLIGGGGWVWLAILPFQGFHFEILLPFGCGILIWTGVLYLSNRRASKRLPRQFYFWIFPWVMILILGITIGWIFFHANLVKFSHILFPHFLAGLVFGLALFRFRFILHPWGIYTALKWRKLESNIYGLKNETFLKSSTESTISDLPNFKPKIKKIAPNFSVFIGMLFFLTFLIMDDWYLVFSVGYYNSIDLIVFFMTIGFATIGFLGWILHKIRTHFHASACS